MLSEPIKLIECPRDAWQGLPRQIPTDLKVEYLRGLIEAGFQHIDAVSFVSPKAVPQMADSEEVLARLGAIPAVEIIGIVVNEKGAERAIATGAVTTLGFPCSVSDTFLRRNQNQSRQENLALLQTVKSQADAAGLNMVAYVSMAFGNPYGEPWAESEIAKAAADMAEIGIAQISLADTVGIAEPALISRLVSTVLRDLAPVEIGVHLHSRREGAAAKIVAAYDAGCRRFDAALGGLGGCPFAQDQLVANIPTEEVVRALRERGVKLPMENNLERPLALNTRIARNF